MPTPAKVKERAAGVSEIAIGAGPAPQRMGDLGIDAESAVAAPPDTSPTVPTPPQVTATPPNLTNVATETNGDGARLNAEGAATLPAGPTISLNAGALAAGRACVNCGLCLPACPTYLETANEADGPRGRIRLMLGMHDGDVPYTAAGQEHLDRCLDCRACETACPSGVIYHRLIEDARHKLEEHNHSAGAKPAPSERLGRWMFENVLTQPARLRLALVPARILQKLGLWALLEKIGAFRLLPQALQRMARLLPDDGPIWPRRLPPHSRGGGIDVVVSMLNPATSGGAKPAAIVGFFEGCISAVMNSDVHRKAAELLCAAGADVISPPDQVCCGAIHLHNNDPEAARALARRNIDTYAPEGGPRLDYIVTCTAGDGAMLRQYGELLADDSKYAQRASEFSQSVRDISEVLGKLRLPPARSRLTGRVTFHDACHLAHAQRVLVPPRELVRTVPGIELVELPESDVCCGAAGTYNITQPEMADALARRKLDRIKETGCQHVVTGNIGCSLHLSAEARQRGQDVVLIHPVELLHAAVFAEA